MSASGYPDEVDDLLDRIDFATLSELRATIVALTTLLEAGIDRSTRGLIATVVDLLEHCADTRDEHFDDELQRILGHS